MLGLFTRDPTGQFEARHTWKRPGFGHELFRRRAVGSHHASQRAHTADVPDQRARVEIPDRGHVVAAQVELRGLGGAPVRGHLRKLAHDQTLDVGSLRLLVVDVGADVSDVRIGQADNLPGIAGIAEDFLVTG